MEVNFKPYIYMTDFFICSVKSPQCTDKNTKKKSITILLPRVLMNQNRWNFASGGVQIRETKTGGWEWLWRHFRTWGLGKTYFSNISLFSYKQRTFVQFLGEFISSQKENDWDFSFPRSFKSWNDVTIISSLLFLVSRGFVGSPSDVTFLNVETRGKKIAIEYFFLPYLPEHCGDFIEQKKSVIYTLRILPK